MKVFIYACEQRYGGLYGIEDFTVEEFDDNESLDDIFEDWVPEMSLMLMESHNVFDDLDPEDYDSEEDYWNALTEEQDNNIDGYVLPIKNDVTESTEELSKIACRLGAGMFKEKYCEQRI